MKKLASGAAALLLAACATPPPSGPGILVLPGTGKSFDQFRFDDQECRGFAHSQIGGKAAEQATSDSAVKSAVVGTAVGTAAGALLGGSQGAAVGAGVGLAGGSIVGSDASRATAGSLQQRYDHAFTQCMYAKGHKVPVTGRYSDAPRPAPSAARTPPPPPPGQPPAEAPPDYRPK
ncbi:MAG TPA: YMGG-like glycine zipper-containing protein [Burkholderiales bacterium]|nr:YMGG-like glycine zipper-containing protein [Burkholderiales bacterium]